MRLDRRTFLSAAPLALLACSRSAEAAIIQVARTPSCGCCAFWVEHLRLAGFEVRVTDLLDVTPVARRLGVPDDLRSCHTGLIEGYAIEGHVPAADIRRLLAERPDAAGLAVHGMPVGSPGMEQGDLRQPYDVILFRRGGRRELFARH